MKTRRALILGLSFFFGAHLIAFGTTHYWTGAASSDFYNTNNWSPVGVPSSTDTIFITNGTVNISPPFTSSGQVTWSGGTVAGLNLASNALLTINGLGTKFLAGQTTNAGTIAVSSPLEFLGFGRTLVNQTGGLIDIQGDVGIFTDGNGGQQILNAGTFRKSAGPNTSPVTGIAVQNSGTILAQSGTMDLQSGGTLAGACTASNGAAITFSGGTFALTNSAVFSGGGLIGVAGGGPSFNGTLATAMSWTGGTVYGQLNIASNGLLAASGLGTRYLQIVVTNSGTITVASPMQFNGSSLLLANQAGGLVDVQGDVGFSSDGNVGQQILNAGILRKSAGPNGCAVNGIAFRNSGTIWAQSGTMDLQSGGALTGVCTADSGAAVIFSGGTFVVTNSATFSGAGFVGVSGGSPSFTGTLATTLDWTGGYLGGNWTLANNGLVLMSGYGTKHLAGTVTNYGTMNLTGILEFHNPGVQVVNQAGALFDVQGDATIFSDGNVGQQIVNAGTFRKSSGTGLLALSITFVNSGQLAVQSGALSLSAPLTMNGGTVNGTVLINSVNLAGTLAGALNWTSGTVNGQLTVGAGATLTLSGSETKYLNAALTNAGTIVLSSPLQFNGGGRTLVNLAGGLIDVEGDVGIFTDGNGGQQILNAGTFRKSAGPNGCAVNGIAFRNAGTVGVLAGQLYLNSPFTNSGGGLVIRLNSASDWGQLICSSSVVLGNPLQVSFANGYAPPVGGQYRIISGASLTGVFSPLNIQNNLASVSYTTNSAWLTITNSVNSMPQLSSPLVNGGSFSFNVSTVNGQSFTIERNDDLGTTNWIFYTNLVGNGSVMQISSPAAGVSHRFFRAHQP